MDQKLLMISEYQTPPIQTLRHSPEKNFNFKGGLSSKLAIPSAGRKGAWGAFVPPPQAAVIAVKPRKIAYYMILRVYTVMHNMETLDMRRLLVTWITLMIMDYPQFTALFVYYRHVVDIF